MMLGNRPATSIKALIALRIKWVSLLKGGAMIDVGKVVWGGRIPVVLLMAASLVACGGDSVFIMQTANSLAETMNAKKK